MRRCRMAKVDEEQPQSLNEVQTCPPWLTHSYIHVVNRHRAGTLPHALLFSGQAELGKRWFAQSLVRTLACRTVLADNALAACGTCESCAQLSVGSSTEFRYLQPAGKSHTIRIDPVRELVEWLQLAASAGRYRIALITGADTMNRAAANALLKTLEEPAARSVCVLVADNPAQLPPTVISRCQQIPLSVESREDALGWLSQQLPEGDDAAAALDTARGAPLRAVREANPDWRNQQSVIDAAWWNLLMHKRSVGAIVESLKDVPLSLCLARFMALSASAIAHRQGAGAYSTANDLSEEQLAAVHRLNSVQWFTIRDDLLRLYRIDSASFKTQTVLEGFLADTRIKING